MRGLEQIVGDFVIEARRDTVGLWRIVNAVRHEFGEIEEDSVQPTSLKVVEGLLNHGAKVIDYYKERGWTTWPEEDTQTILARIKREWDALGQDPNLGDVCWFSLMKRDGLGEEKLP